MESISHHAWPTAGPWSAGALSITETDTENIDIMFPHPSILEE